MNQRIYNLGKVLLEDFFDLKQGTTFTWIDPEIGSGEITVLFSDDEIEFNSVAISHDTILWEADINIEEQR